MVTSTMTSSNVTTAMFRILKQESTATIRSLKSFLKIALACVCFLKIRIKNPYVMKCHPPTSLFSRLVTRHVIEHAPTSVMQNAMTDDDERKLRAAQDEDGRKVMSYVIRRF